MQNITSTALKRPNAATLNRSKKSDSTTLFLDLDPFSGVKDVVRTGAEETGQFIKGAIPGYGSKAHFETLWGSGDQNKARAGFLLNLAGTASLAVGLGMAAFGVDPTVAYGISAGALGGSGVLNAMIN